MKSSLLSCITLIKCRFCFLTEVKSLFKQIYHHQGNMFLQGKMG